MLYCLPIAMADIESLLNRWQSAGVLDAQAAGRIRTWEAEQEHPVGIHWQGALALILGALLLASGVVLFVSANWDQLGPIARFIIVIAMVAIFHVAAGFTRESFRGLSTALHAIGTVSTGAAIALVGQIFNIQEHWPAAILLWALAALAGWALLHDEAQQILTLLLFPAWLCCELAYATERDIGQSVYLGRFLFMWAILYLTVFLRSKREAVQGILFAVGAISAVLGVVLMLEGWRSWFDQPFIPLHTRLWAWAAIALAPLLFSMFGFARSTVPVITAIVFTIELPWCSRIWVAHYQLGPRTASYTQSEPNMLAHALVAAYAIFLIWWGVRTVSKALVNYGVVTFGISILWFFFSDIFDKVGRSLGLIGIGILFLAGGWALEKTRRRLLAAMAAPGAASGAAPSEAQ
jgi:Predicted membrane protein (DUF2157)